MGDFGCCRVLNFLADILLRGRRRFRLCGRRRRCRRRRRCCSGGCGRSRGRRRHKFFGFSFGVFEGREVSRGFHGNTLRRRLQLLSGVLPGIVFVSLFRFFFRLDPLRRFWNELCRGDGRSLGFRHDGHLLHVRLGLYSRRGKRRGVLQDVAGNVPDVGLVLGPGKFVALVEVESSLRELIQIRLDAGLRRGRRNEGVRDGAEILRLRSLNLLVRSFMDSNSDPSPRVLEGKISLLFTNGINFLFRNDGPAYLCDISREDSEINTVQIT